MIGEKPRAGPPLWMVADQSPSGSLVAKEQSVKLGRRVSNTTDDRAAPLPSAPWQLAHAAKKISCPVSSFDSPLLSPLPGFCAESMATCTQTAITAKVPTVARKHWKAFMK